jgi:tetratricopeptide (TPR) repeat protein
MIAFVVFALLHGDPEAAARLHFEKAERAYRVGNYDVAVDEYQAAYDAKSAPEFLFNLAQALRKRFAVAGATGDLRRGIEVFRAYLREDPQTPKRETVERLLTDMRATLADIEAREAKPAPVVQPVPTQKLEPQPPPPQIVIREPPPPPPEEEPPVYKKWWFWTAIGGAVVAGTVTAIAVSSSGTNLHGPTIDLSH